MQEWECYENRLLLQFFLYSQAAPSHDLAPVPGTVTRHRRKKMARYSRGILIAV